MLLKTRTILLSVMIGKCFFSYPYVISFFMFENETKRKSQMLYKTPIDLALVHYCINYFILDFPTPLITPLLLDFISCTPPVALYYISL